jgi:hypothetical protein
VTFHSYGQYILYPWGYAKRVPSDHTEVQRVGQVIATAIKKTTSVEYTVGNSATLLYPAAGKYKFLFLKQLNLYIYNIFIHF